MIRLPICMLLALVLAAGARAEEKITVTVIAGGAYYHRPAHLTVPGTRELALSKATQDGFDPCPECTPPALVNNKVRDRGVSPYYENYLAARGDGVFSGKIVGKLSTLAEQKRAAVENEVKSELVNLLRTAAGPTEAAAAPAPAAAAPAAPAALSASGSNLTAPPIYNYGNPYGMSTGIVNTSTNYQGQPVQQPR